MQGTSYALECSYIPTFKYFLYLALLKATVKEIPSISRATCSNL